MTRRHLYLAGGGNAYEVAACDALVPVRLDFAIQAVLCTWWLSGFSADEDRDAVSEAVQ